MKSATLAAVAALAASACQGQAISRIPSGGGSSTAGASSGGLSSSSGVSSSGTARPSSNSGATGTGTGTGGATTGASSGATTGTGSPYWDGGYVHCSLPFAADGGIDGHGGPATWLCVPGTYLCDTSGNLGNCFQCLSDADCVNQALPTYDPIRPRCDLDSGIAGYENHCQGCLTSADCAGNPADPFCDLQAISSPGIDSLEPSFIDLGFETCGPILEDCRLDGGPSCTDLDAVCDPRNGQCDFRDGSCTTNQDCAGMVSTEFPYLSTPVCSDGYCGPCDGGGSCLYVACDSGADCSVIVPACVNGFCGCDQEDQCSDAGLICVPPTPGFVSTAFCGVPCTAPSSPPCSIVIDESHQTFYAICNPSTGLCEHCTTEQQCQSGVDTGGPTCLSNGECGCTMDSDCPAGQACQPGYLHETCVPRASSCSLESCGHLWCDWDSGECANVGVGAEGQPCIDDYDCSHGDADDYCDPKTGTCVACRNNADCEHLGGGGRGLNCLAGDAGPARCGCTSDEGCVGIVAGGHCDMTASDPGFETCGCRTTTECPAGEVCGGQSGCYAASVTCHTDDDCQTSFFCAPDGACRPRCDQAHACQGSDPLCDTHNALGENDAGDVWCFQCLQGSDCPEGQGCNQNTHVCGSCSYDGECREREYCTSNRTCQLSCDAGVCPAGWVCDTEDVAGTGYSTCYQCLNAADCPGDQGCNPYTHTCGSCVFPLYGYDLLSDCPPDAICSAFWSELGVFSAGVCLPNCDRISCPADKPICAILPALTPDHHYCFGCLTDADCADAGPGAWCDVSVGMTFACQTP